MRSMFPFHTVWNMASMDIDLWEYMRYLPVGCQALNARSRRLEIQCDAIFAIVCLRQPLFVLLTHCYEFRLEGQEDYYLS